ncbi:AraC family transcriptional regulator [uncultured Neptuniibacter sp.]|uniref:AraC family transcriptional regulator n=1 Tax=uncultured Neptuniibacter sp. TaxID=502143 RepID=UPI00260A1BF4|nr:AraC family transcriptional regulator [uncultured Neptuniibacter sp.]
MKTDALSEMLSWLRLKAEVYIHAEFQGCWAVDTSGSRRVPFHLVNSGKSWLHLKGESPRLLSAGDLVVFPRDEPHYLSSESEPPSPDLVARTVASIGEKKSGEITGLTCGYFEFENKQHWPLLDSLPAAIVLELSDTSRQANTRALLHLLVAELVEAEPGFYQSVSYLTHTLFIHILRSQLARGEQTGLLAALFHPQVGQALNLIHTQPERHWTLEMLARKIGMSRAGFAVEFKRLTGTTAMLYLSQWRMLQATELLRTSDLSVFAIAERCGYQTEASFRKAFKNIVGQSPGVIRKHAGAV